MGPQKRDQEPRPAPKVGIIVLNWNGWQDTIECLASVRRLTYPNFRIVLVDNGSLNESVLKIREWCAGNRISIAHVAVSGDRPEENGRRGAEPPGAGDRTAETDGQPFVEGSSRMTLILSERNLGFAGGNNLGIRYALRQNCRYVWLLNSDTVVDPDALTQLVLMAESDERLGMVGSRLLDDDPARTGPRPAPEPRRPPEAEVKHVSGASLLARAACVRDIGPIDERYFLYGEEVDWCLQARRKGWRLSINPRSLVVHKWGASTRSKRTKKRVLGHEAVRISWEGFPVPGYYEARNGIYFIRKNRPALLVPYAILRTMRLLFKILLYDDHKAERSRIILRGARDGMLGRMGMMMDPAHPLSK